jgi:hypothetical protein
LKTSQRTKQKPTENQKGDDNRLSSVEKISS